MPSPDDPPRACVDCKGAIYLWWDDPLPGIAGPPVAHWAHFTPTSNHMARPFAQSELED